MSKVILFRQKGSFKKTESFLKRTKSAKDAAIWINTIFRTDLKSTTAFHPQKCARRAERMQANEKERRKRNKG